MKPASFLALFALVPLGCAAALPAPGESAAVAPAQRPAEVTAVALTPAPGPVESAKKAEAPPPSGEGDAGHKGAESGVIGLTGAAGSSDPDAPTAPWGKGDTDTGTGQGSGSGRLGGARDNPPKIRMGATSVSGRLPPEVIQRIVRQNFGRFRLCYENGLRADPRLEGKVVVKFEIDSAGAVSAVSLTKDTTIPDKGMNACVERSFHGLSFPQPEGGKVIVSYPLLFSPADPAPPATAPAAPSAPKGP